MSASSSLTSVPGFRAVGVACGLKQSGQPDLALILADTWCNAAAVFTTNKFKAAPVLYDMALLENHRHLQAVVINAGNANAVTGAQGLADAEQMARLTETTCQLPPASAFVMSTGVIGHPLPMDRIRAGIQQAAELIQTDAGQHGLDAAQAILTTDLVPKEALIQCNLADQTISIGGIAKGSGMIHPNMATMLAVIVTNARVEPVALDAALRQAVAKSFNRISVDGDTSTNDTAVILASGQANHPPITPNTVPEFETFSAALAEVCIQLAKGVARDGEGATKLLEINITGALNEAEATAAANSVATSPLVKTALFGNDPNWGRILAAIGRSGVQVDVGRTALWLDQFQLVADGSPLDYDVVAIHDRLSAATEVRIIADLGVGQAQATVWSCDLSYKYVEINAEYHT